MRKARPVTPVLRVQLAYKDLKVQLVDWVNQVLPVVLVLPVDKDLLELRVPPDLEVTSVLPVDLVYKAVQVPLEHEVAMEVLDRVDLLDHQDLREILVSQEQMDSQDHRDLVVNQVRRPHDHLS